MIPRSPRSTLFPYTTLFRYSMNRYMNRRNMLTKVGIVLMLATLLTTGAIWEVRRVHAVNPPDPDQNRSAHVCTPVTDPSRLPSATFSKQPNPTKHQRCRDDT